MLNLVMTQGPLAQLYQWHEVKRPSGDDREGRSREGDKMETARNVFEFSRRSFACVLA